MHVHLPKPLHGWREFAGEVGIIVIGVLIALGAEQVVEDFHRRAQQRAFRETIDHEIGLNLFVYDLRARQIPCDEKQMNDLVDWLARARSGEKVPVLYPVGPTIITPYRSAWENRNSGVFDELPATQRQKYAEFYDELSNNWELMQREQTQWRLLHPYKEIGPITLADRRAIRPIISEIISVNGSLKGNFPVSQKIARLLHATEVRPDNLPDQLFTAVGACSSVVASPSLELKLNPVLPTKVPLSTKRE